MSKSQFLVLLYIYIDAHISDFNNIEAWNIEAIYINWYV